MAQIINPPEDEHINAARNLFSLTSLTRIRDLAGGMAGSRVSLVEYADGGALRLGVLKVIPKTLREDFERERDGADAASRDWLAPLACDAPRCVEHGDDRLMLTPLAVTADDRRSNRSLHDLIEARRNDAALTVVAALLADTYAAKIGECLTTDDSRKSGTVFDTVKVLLGRWAGSIHKVDWQWWNYPGFEEEAFLDGDTSRRNPLWAAFEPAAWRDENVSLPWSFVHGDANCRNVLVFEGADGSDGRNCEIRLIDWEKAEDASLYLDPCWLSMWAVMAAGDNHVAVHSDAWERLPGAFVAAILNGEQPSRVEGFEAGLGFVATLWGGLWRHIGEQGHEKAAVRPAVALTLGAAALAKAHYELRDLDGLRRSKGRWKEETIRWVACFFRIAALAWEESQLLTARPPSRGSLVAADVTGLPTGQISGVMKRVFTDTWAPEDVVTIAEAMHQATDKGLTHGLTRAAAERLQAKVPARADQIRPLIDRVFSLAEQKTTSDPAVRWLTETIGIDRIDSIEGMSDRDRVRFLISALPQDNHRGAGPHESKTWNRLEELRQKTANIPEQWLLEADVTMAVGFANVMDFEEAARWLRERWSGERSPESIPGLAAEAGKFHSSLGQYEAFLGRYDVAEEHFTRAIALLDRIDEPKTRLDQITQTKTYLAFALLEHNVRRADEVIDELLRLNVRVSLADAGTFFAGTSQSPYLHHLFVRRATKPAFDASAYVNARANWQRQSFHPWELIDWGRAQLLLDVDRNTAARCLSRACETALGGTSVLAAIGTVIAAYGACMDLLPAGPLLDRALGRAVREQHSKHVHLDFQQVIDAMCDPHPERVKDLISLLPFNYH